MRDARKQSTEDVRLHLGVLIGTIQRHECRNDLRLVFKEFPMLGLQSMLAARAALASRAQGLYEAIHGELLGRRAPSTSIASWPSPAPSVSTPSGLRATWRTRPWIR